MAAAISSRAGFEALRRTTTTTTGPHNQSQFRHIHSLSPRHLLNPSSICRALSVSSGAVERTMKGNNIVLPPLHPTYDLKAVIRLALAEDAAHAGDITSLATIPPQVQAEAQFLAKEDGLLAGIAMADIIFQEVDPSLKVEWTLQDGDRVSRGVQFGSVYGCARSILLAERVVLNFMQRMSGIATLTKAMVEAAKPARILETRKTAPGLRLVDKWAVLIGGGENHRIGLFDMVLVKDNHIAVAGGVAESIAAVSNYLKEKNLDVGVEIETRTLEEVKEVLAHKGSGIGRVTRIMLDNMVVPLPNGDVDVSMLKKAVDLVDGQLETEASGNVTLSTVGKIGSTGVTFISRFGLNESSFLTLGPGLSEAAIG